MTFHKIQKDLTRSYAEEITEVIKEKIGDSLFSVLIDESHDISVIEQMAVLVRFVNKKGEVVERFLGLKHVEDTTSSALKKVLTEILAAHGLPIGRLRGQGHDGASNMRGEFNGLQKQIRDENPYAFYVHCFAHQLQLVIVSVASCCSSFNDFFNYASASCKRKDKLVTKHRETILNKIESGKIFKGRGLHQTTSLARPGDTRWGSHFTTLICIESTWDSVVNVLSMIHEDERNPGRAGGLVRKMESFSFVLNMKLMLKVFRITNNLSLLLQRKYQNIVQAMSLLFDVKTRLETLLEEVKSFCVAKNIPIPNMDEAIPRWGRSRLQGDLITQGHHYRVDTFFAALDAILTEMDHRFNEVSSELLVCFACLDPRNNFSKFDVDKIARLTEIYDEDFSSVDRSNIRDQLGNYIIHVRRIDVFAGCHDLRSLAIKMVELERDRAFPLVYRLIELALILPMATASVERAFSAMHFIKTDLRNKIPRQFPSKEDHAQDALHQVDCDINLCGSLVRKGGKRKRMRDSYIMMMMNLTKRVPLHGSVRLCGSDSTVLPGAASAVEGLEALCRRPRAVLRLPLHRHEVEACTTAPAGRGRNTKGKAVSGGPWRNGRSSAEQSSRG
ncbi:hypothetical protein U9M48_025351 [Paspalum notatum var. saurae]|uniref:DUF4371 domain-containing protein n=1 Tax=Paspalum notatum var. saurae TaxID=547442 RepID=A0AAQ3TUS0_PASNO